MPKSKKRKKAHTVSALGNKVAYRVSMERNIHNIVVQMFAAFAISLHRLYGFGYTRTLRALAETHALYNEMAKYGNDYINNVCLEETGLDIMHITTADTMDIQEGAKI